MSDRKEAEMWQDAIILKHLVDRAGMPFQSVVERTQMSQSQVQDRIWKLKEISEVFGVPLKELPTNPLTCRGGKIGYLAKRMSPEEVGNIIAIAKKGEMSLYEMARSYERSPYTLIKIMRSHGIDLITIKGSPEQKRAERAERDRKLLEEKDNKLALQAKQDLEKARASCVAFTKQDNKQDEGQQTLDKVSGKQLPEEAKVVDALKFSIARMNRELRDVNQSLVSIISLLADIKDQLKKE